MEPKDQIFARMYAVLMLLCAIPLLVVLQALRIHFGEADELRAQGERQASSYVTIPAIRGAILDRTGRTLATNTARYDLAVDPSVKGFKAVESTFFERLSKLSGRPAAEFRRKVRARRSPQYVRLMRGIAENQKEEIETWGIPGLILDPTFVRRYNYGEAMAHVLGHTGSDGNGLSGLELYYDSVLRGRDGRRAVKRDRLGIIKAVVQGQVIEPEHGESLVLTIDLLRQTILEEELARGVAEVGATWGTAVAMDPKTGAIIAMANVPTYDPNRPGSFPADSRRNRALTDRLEPGSTFKLLTAIAAVEQGLVTPEDSIDTGNGWAVFAGRTMRDTHANGTITFADVIARSSNVGTAKTAARLKPGAFYQYARNLGFGQPTWIDLPGEVEGLLKKPSRWSGTTLTSMSIGYEIDVTALQLLVAYASLANDGLLVRPHVVAERRDVTGEATWTVSRDSVRRAFDARTAQLIKPAFERVVEEGTGKKAKLEIIPVAGKTGTARKAVGGTYRAGAYRSSFVGYFPADHPEVVLIVVLDEPRSATYGGAAAAPIFQRTAKRWVSTYPTIAARVSPPDELPEPPSYELPDLSGMPGGIAEKGATAAGYRVRLTGSDWERGIVAAQDPAPGAAGLPGTPVRLVVSDSASAPGETVPKVVGLSTRSATTWLRKVGFEVRIEGNGIVVAQTPEAGEVGRGTVWLRSR